jgi:hypothetical protein
MVQRNVGAKMMQVNLLLHLTPRISLHKSVQALVEITPAPSSCKVAGFVAGGIMVVAKVNRKMVSVVRTSDDSIPFFAKTANSKTPFFPGTFLHVSTGTRTTCAVEVKSHTTSIHCWGGRANALLDQVDFQRNERRLAVKSSGDLDDDMQIEDGMLDDIANYQYQHISLGQDHGCASTNVNKDNSSSSSSTSSSLECWWMTGSDFDAHRVPVGLGLITMA